MQRTRNTPNSVANSFTSGIDPGGQSGINISDGTFDDDLSKMISHYRLIDEVWHWSTVDEGRRYVSLGYNSLHSTSGSKDPSKPLDNKPTDTERGDLPEGKRVWSWLVLCEDKTVLNIHEDPYPEKHGVYDREELATLYSIRRNLLNVFRNLSKCFDISRSAAIAVLPIRRRVGDSEEERAHRPSDAPGLLFYNLFDDWYSTYSLVARREHKYAAALDRLRADMMQKAELVHVERLHRIGRQLSVLKRMYQSYEVIIDRVLEKQETTLASLKNSHILSPLDEGNSSMLDDGSYCASSNAHRIDEDVSMLGVALSSAARARFKRLKYRTRLYAISEIEECLSQKESLVMMVRPLIPPLKTLLMPAPTQTELQPHRHQGVTLGRATDTGDVAARKGDTSLHARLYHGCLFFLPIQRPGVHRCRVLDLVRHCSRRQHSLHLHLQRRVRHHGGQNAVPQLQPRRNGHHPGVVGQKKGQEGKQKEW